MRPFRLSGLILLLAISISIPTAPAVAQMRPIVTGIGLVKYNPVSSLKVGQWVTYKIKEIGGGQQAESDQKIAVVGFETVGGEKCVWIESKFAANGAPARLSKVLVSLSIARDPEGTDGTKIATYVRRVLFREGPLADVKEMAMGRVVPFDSTNSKPKANSSTGVKEDRDSLPQTEVSTAVGKFHVRPFRIHRTIHMVIPSPKGSRLHEQDEEEVNFLTPQVPLTHVAYQTIKASVLDAMIPLNAPRDYRPSTPANNSLREAVVTGFGTGAVSEIKKNAKTTPLITPPSDEEVEQAQKKLGGR